MWQDFTTLGDDFLIAYSRLDSQTVPATLFTVGHAVELYLKATLLKINPADNILSYGHRIDKMLVKIQQLEPALLSNYILRETVYDKFMNGQLIPSALTADPDYQHYISNQELYWVSKYLMDLKYLGAAHKILPTTFSILVVPLNPYWVNFFKILRTYLQWPMDNQFANPINECLTNRQLISEEQRLFLKSL